MIITIIGDIFTNVSGKLKNNQLKELTHLMLDNDWLFDLFSFFKHVKYILVFSKELGKIEQTDEESRFMSVKNNIKDSDSRNRLNAIHKATMDVLSKKIESRGNFVILYIASSSTQLSTIRDMTAKYEEKMNHYNELFKDMKDYINSKS
jgi:hypothetical protein